MVYGTVHLIYNIVFRFVELPEVIDGELRSAGLVIFPAIQLHGCIEICISYNLVVLLQIGLVDSLDGESAHSYSAVIDEVGEDSLSVLQFQLVCHQLGYENLVMARFVVKLGNASFNHVLMDKG